MSGGGHIGLDDIKASVGIVFAMAYGSTKTWLEELFEASCPQGPVALIWSRIGPPNMPDQLEETRP